MKMLNCAAYKEEWHGKNHQQSVAMSVERYFCLVFFGYFF
jgi:hypothetical protein